MPSFCSFHPFLVDQGRDEIKNTGIDCWYFCNKRQGPCPWCGTEGSCCTQKSGWTDISNGCDGTFGGLTRHECSMKIN